MAKKELRNRANWQEEGGAKAGLAELAFFDLLTKEFDKTPYKIRSKPKEFNNIYVDIKLADSVVEKIFNPNETWKHGVVPDYAIDNIETKKTIYVEVKRQDGWVEGKPRNAGRGNAHERSNKFFTPGLMKILREKGGLGPDVIPFWVVFQGDIARDPKRVREITCWYQGCEDHFFLWHDNTDSSALVEHFKKKIRPLLG
jgi:hypothetical protein